MPGDMNQIALKQGTVYRFNLFWITLILCSYGVFTTLGGLTLRLEKIVMLAATLILSAVFIMRGCKLRLTRPEILLAVWLLTGVISSLVSANPPSALRHTADLAISASIFFFANMWRVERVLLLDPRPVYKVGILLGAGSMVVAFFHLTGLIGHFPWMSEFVMVEDITSFARVKMTMWEANLLGAIMMVFSLLSVAEFRRNSRRSRFMLLACHAGLLTAYSRGPILGYFAGLLLYFHLLGNRKMTRISLVAVLAIVLLSVSVLIGTVTGKTIENNYMRFTSLYPRLFSILTAFEDIKTAPVIGNGTYSMEFLHAGEAVSVGAGEDAKGWISVLPVAVLHDTGLVGFSVLSAFFLLIFRNASRIVRRLRGACPDAAALRRMAAWFGAGIGMHVLSITTSAYSLAAFWMVMAVVASIPKAGSRLKPPAGWEGGRAIRPGWETGNSL